MATVFLTLRDKLADISVQVTCSRQLADSLATPLVEGASVVIHAKPTYYANRGTLSLQAREIRMVGLGELLARLEQRRQLLAAEGLFADERKRALPFLPRTIGLVTAQNSAAERDVVDNATPALAGGAVRRAVRRHAGHQRRPRRDRGRAEAGRRPGGRRDRGRPRRRLGRGPAAVLRRGPGPCGVRARPRRSSRAIGHEPDSPLLDLVADLRASTPTDAAKRVVPDVAEEAQRVLPDARARPAARCATCSPASTSTSPRCAADRRWPTRGAASPSARWRSTRCASAPVVPSPTGSTAPATTSATGWPGCAACRRSRPCGAATPSSRPPTATWSPTRRPWRPATSSTCAWPTAGSAPP